MSKKVSLLMLKNISVIIAERQQQMSRFEHQNSHWQLSFLLVLKTSQISRLVRQSRFLSVVIGIHCDFSVQIVSTTIQYSSVISINSVLSLNVTIVMSICICLQRKIKILAFHAHICQRSTAFCDKHCVCCSLVALQGTRFRDMFACLFANTVK